MICSFLNRRLILWSMRRIVRTLILRFKKWTYLFIEHSWAHSRTQWIAPMRDDASMLISNMGISCRVWEIGLPTPTNPVSPLLFELRPAWLVLWYEICQVLHNLVIREWAIFALSCAPAFNYEKLIINSFIRWNQATLLRRSMWCRSQVFRTSLESCFLKVRDLTPLLHLNTRLLLPLEGRICNSSRPKIHRQHLCNFEIQCSPTLHSRYTTTHGMTSQQTRAALSHSTPQLFGRR